MALSRSSFSNITATPPRKGPNSKGLNIKTKQATTITAEKLNGRNRQNITKRFTRRQTT
jgi:hypothetical protein